MRRTVPGLLALAVPAALSCCSSSTDAPAAAPLGDASVAANDGAVIRDASPDVGNTAVPTTSDAACGIEKMCLDLELTPPPTEPFSVVVYWAQLDDDGPDPAPEVGYQVQVTPGTTRVEIPLAEVKAPKDEKVLYCERATNDEAASPCTGEPKVAYGIVVATTKPGSVKVKDGTLGFADAMFGWSGKTFAPGATPKPLLWDSLWPEGIFEGVHVFQGFRPAGTAFDRPVPSKTPGRLNKIAAKGLNLT